jgi:DNA ligase-1
VLFADVARVSAEVAATRARSRKTESMAALLASAEPHDAGLAVRFLSGELRQRRTGLGYAALRDLPPPADEPTLSVTDVDKAFEALATLSGAGSQGERRRRFLELAAAATQPEQHLLAALVAGELRQGALESLVTDALAKAVRLPAADVRRAVMLRGELGAVAAAAVADGAAGLEQFRLEVGRPLQPMLAQSAADVEEALERTGPAAVEWKLDGIRVQVHRDGDTVHVFTRTLDDITTRVPEVVEATLALDVRSVVLDGEALALGDGGRPRPFQVTAARTGSKVDVAAARRATALSAFFFDVLHLDGHDLLGQDGAQRQEALVRAVPESLRVPRLVTDDPAAAEAFSAEALAAGHEGVVVKSLAAAYEAGRRGAGWVKVKPRHTFDLVVLAAEWGHGRRRGWLSNLHLGARDDSGEGFVMLGKTFKGLTDEMLRWQTGRLLELEDRRAEWGVVVRPELVVEVAFDGVQASPRYPGGVALRFARVLRHRPDKPAFEADTLASVLALHAP